MMKRNQKGITLIALVITIIIMLILAGVALNIALGDNGIFKMAQKATEKYKTAQSEEDSTMQEISDELQGLIGKGKDDKTPGVIDGEGTEEKPFLIESIEDLVQLSNNVNAGTTYENQIVKLAVNLDFKSEDSYVNSKNKTYGDINGINGAEELKTELITGTGFKSIGNDQKQFKGTFDGQNRTISNLYINVAANYQGLFGYVGNNGTVKNLTISNADINCESSRIGTLTGHVNGGTIENIKTNNGKVTGNQFVGGIVGGCYNKSTINNCINNNNIISKGKLNSEDNNIHLTAGGISGICDNSTIMNSHNIGTVYAIQGIELGGIVGVAGINAIIDSCYNEGKIGDSENNCLATSIGGIAGDISTNSKVSKSYNIGEIAGRGAVGGIVGNLGWNAKAYIENCYNIGVVTSIQGNIGGICYANASTTESEIKNCYNVGYVNATAAINSNIRKHCWSRK